MLKLIVGLSNFDVRYFKTRHNVGAWYIEKLMKYNGLSSFEKRESYGYVTKLFFNNSYVRLLIPTTYMNLSGSSVLSCVKSYKLFLDEVLIVHDELDLLPGSVRLKFSGGHNGHNGLKDIIKRFKSNNFYRLRIGIGRPKKKNLIKYFVLNEPSLEEKKKLMQ